MSRNRFPLLLFSGVLTLSAVTYTFFGVNVENFQARNRPGICNFADEKDTLKACELFRDAEKHLRSVKYTKALTCLEQARYFGIIISRYATVGDIGDDISPSSLLLRLARTLSTCARQAATDGQRPLAWSLLHGIEMLAEQTLETPKPTLEALQTARALDLIVMRTEIALLYRFGEPAHAEHAAEREKMLRELYARHITPSILIAMKRHENARAKSLSAEHTAALDEQDCRLAVVLIEKYRNNSQRRFASGSLPNS
jgi:hypothetical protein